MNHLSLTMVCTALLATSAAGQVCPAGSTQLLNDSLPANPSGSQPVAVVAGICVGDKAASVFDVSSFPAPVKIRRAGILFAGPNGSVPGGGKLELYDGVTLQPNGSAVLGPMVFQSQSVSYPVNALQSLDVTSSNVTISSGTLVVAFTLESNPNEPFPGLGCALGYSANFASDTIVPPGTPCQTTPGTNLLYDSQQGWWDVSAFKIGGQNWCGQAFNGNWVIRACIDATAPMYPGTGDDLAMTSGVGLVAPDATEVKTATAGNLYTVHVESPANTFVGTPLFLLLDAFATGGNPPTPLLPGVQVGSGLILLAGGASTPLGPIVLPPGGASTSFAIPAGLTGASFMFQAAVLAPFAQNGSYATTDAHVLEVQ